jgi:hypothetical protein
MPIAPPLLRFRRTLMAAKVGGRNGSRGFPKGWLKAVISCRSPKTQPVDDTTFSKRSFSTQDVGKMSVPINIHKLNHDSAVENCLGTKTYGNLALNYKTVEDRSLVVALIKLEEKCFILMYPNEAI